MTCIELGEGTVALITGGAGFIGSHLAEELVKRGVNVRILDNFSTGKRENISKIVDKVELIEGDIRDSEIVSKAVRGVDIVFHLAAVVGVKRYVENPLEVIEVNTQGTHNILREAYRQKVKRVVFASTSEVYGKNSNVPLREDDNRVLGPTFIDRWCYSTSKALDEHLCYAYYRLKGLDVVILRYFNIYGPRANTSAYGGVVSRFVTQVLRDEPPTVFGSGRQTRTFTYVTDAVEGTILAAESSKSSGEVFNIGSEYEISIVSLAKLIIKLAGKEGHLEPTFIPYEKFYGRWFEDIMRRVPDISKAKRTLGFQPKVNLEKGLKLTIEWYRKHL